MKHPFSNKLMFQILAILLVLGTLTAGYFQTLYTIEVKKYKNLEDRYVRVRSMLGTEETQRLIDLSHEKEQIENVESW